MSRYACIVHHVWALISVLKQIYLYYCCYVTVMTFVICQCVKRQHHVTPLYSCIRQRPWRVFAAPTWRDVETWRSLNQPGGLSSHGQLVTLSPLFNPVNTHNALLRRSWNRMLITGREWICDFPRGSRDNSANPAASSIMSVRCIFICASCRTTRF